MFICQESRVMNPLRSMNARADDVLGLGNMGSAAESTKQNLLLHSYKMGDVC